MRVIKPINFQWKYKSDFKEEYIDNLDLEGFEDINIPHTNKEVPYNNFDENLYQFVSCYKKEIDILEEYKGKDIFLCFDGVGNYAKVYINGKFAGEHKGGYTPFEIKIDELVHTQSKNIITVVVDSTEREEIPPFGNVVDYLTYGGIYREVYLKVINKTNIKDIFIKTNNVLNEKKELEIQCMLSQFKENLSLECEIIDKNSNVIKNFIENNIASSKFVIRESVSNVELWDIENPNMYTLNIKLKSNNIVLDEENIRFGFREAVFKTDGFYLNGKRVKIRGLNRHQSYAYVGYAMPKSMQEKDAEILKYELGVNLVRTSHYPQSKHFLNKCDEIGLLVFTEIPGWQYISENDEWRKIVLQNVKEMIIRDRNHPCVIIWGVRINESDDCDELYEKTNRLAHELDDTRQTGGVRKHAGSTLLEDVYTYNDFVHVGSNQPLDNPKKICKSDTSPYLVTEHSGHMYPTKSFDHEEKRLEHALRHMRILDEMYGNDRISGAIGWCMFDYNTHKDFGSGDKICYHGVMDMFRNPKLAASVYSSQQEEKIVMDVASSMDIGEHPGGQFGEVYVFTNCDYIKLYKNNKFIGDFYPDKEQFKHVPHPPVKINDFIGPLLRENENFSDKDSDIMKEVLLASAKHGMDMPLKYKLKMAYLMLKTKLTFDDGYRLYSKYIGNWGEKQTEYKFEGYKNNKLVKTVIKKSAVKPQLKVSIGKSELIEDETYDVTEVSISAVCENGNLLSYANDVISIEVEGPIEVIGPKHIALIGGSIATYVKTTGKLGEATIKIKSNNLGENIIKCRVI